MNANIYRECCIGCGLCPTICPAVFRIADDGLAEVYTNPIPEQEYDNAIEAQENCPVSVINVE